MALHPDQASHVEVLVVGSTTEHYKGGVMHRTDGPAIEDEELEWWE